MLPQLAEILQDALNFTRYAASPFVLNTRPDSIRQWLHALRDHLATLIAIGPRDRRSLAFTRRRRLVGRGARAQPRLGKTQLSE